MTSYIVTLCLVSSFAAVTFVRRRPSQRFWDSHARRYDRTIAVLNRRFGQVAAQVASDASGSQNMLELAAGTGLITAVAAPQTVRYVATDVSTQMLAALRQRTATLAQVQVQHADALELPFQDGSFDCVLIGNLLHLLPDPRLALAEARRVLGPGGRLLVPTFCHGQGWLARTVSRLLRLGGLRTHHRFTGAELDELVAGAGFVVTGARSFRGLLPVRYVRAVKRDG